MARQNAIDYTVQTQTIKCFVCGDYGTGKSVFASSFPQPGYVLNCDNKMGAYEGSDWIYEEFPPSPLSWTLIGKELTLLDKEVKENKYKTVVLDSCTSLMDIALQQSMQLDPKRSPTGGPIWNVHFTMTKNLVEGVIKRILRYNCNVVILAHLKPEMDEDGNIVKYEPLLSGQLSVNVPGMFDEVYIADYVMKNQKANYIIRTAPHGKKKARSAIKGKENRIPDVIPNNYKALTNAARKENTA